jgi:hypothetical protein
MAAIVAANANLTNGDGVGVYAFGFTASEVKVWSNGTNGATVKLNGISIRMPKTQDTYYETFAIDADHIEVVNLNGDAGVYWIALSGV